MSHVPHLFLPRPWGAGDLEVGTEQRHHLEQVLRIQEGEPVSYTDGEGYLGAGSYLSGSVSRGEERLVPRPSELLVVVAPPENRDRTRFLVEKLAELGVAELRFLRTRYGEGRPPKVERLRSWAISGIEQSRGAWLLKIAEGLVTFADIQKPYLVCDRGGRRDLSARTVVVGPEGGWAPGEIPDGADRYDLGETVLRVETAALVAAARLL